MSATAGLYVLGLILACYALYVVPPLFAKALMRRRFLDAVRRARCVCLTFDDGPDPSSTPQVLRALREAGVKATFFCIGSRVEKHPHLARAIVEQGHEIGEHGCRHRMAWWTDPFLTVRDLAAGSKALRPFLPNDARPFLRPPYGKLNLASLIYVAAKRRRLAFWNVDPKDYENDSPEMIVRFVRERVGEGGVILLHDGRRGGKTSPSCATAAAVGGILAVCRGKGLRLCTLSDALGKANRGERHQV